VEPKKKKKNPLDKMMDELEGYDEGIDEPSPVISSGY
jgi:hypothetical protein